MAQPAPHKWGLYETIKETDICPECLEDPPNITHHFSSGDVVCLSCGLVLGGNIIDTRSEWRTFADGDGKKADPNRVGDAANPLLFGEGLETRIGGDTAASISLSRAQMLASKTADDKGNTKLREGFAVIDSFCASGKLNSMVVEASKHWFSLAIKGGWFNSYPMDIYIGFIFWGCKTGQHARTAGELSSLGGGQYSKKTISKAATRINNKFMQMGVDMMLRSADFGSSSSKSDSTPRLGSSSVTTATSLIPRFCQTVGDIPVWAETIACGISEALRDTMALDSRSASNVATCSIYLMLHLVELPRHWDNVYPVSGLGKGAMNTALNMLHRKRDEIVKNAYFPADKRVHISHWDDIIDKEWTDSKRNKIKRFDTAAPNAKKRKAGTQDEPETKKPKTEPTSRAISSAIGGFKSSRAVPAIGDRGNSRGPTSSSFVGGSGSSRGVTPVPEMAKTPGTAVTPPPFKYGTGFGPASEQKVFVWRGLYLPGSMSKKKK